MKHFEHSQNTSGILPGDKFKSKDNSRYVLHILRVVPGTTCRNCDTPCHSKEAMFYTTNVDQQIRNICLTDRAMSDLRDFYIKGKNGS
jgi:hypothetical protein